jgi:ABC-type lipoprotein release transport system permease subunit
MWIRLAWKNVWRNRVRSGVLLGAIAIGLFAGTYLSAFISGWMLGTVKGDIDASLAHVQIHDTAFLANNDIKAAFMQTPVREEIERQAWPVSLSCRLKVAGMLASANNAVGIAAKGVSVADEKEVSDIWQRIPDSSGVFLPDEAKMPIVISRKIAEKLKVRLKSKIVFTFQDVHGEMQSVAFRVCGIYKTTNAAFDEGNIFVRRADLLPYTGLPEDAVHEVAVKADGLETCQLIAPQIKALFPDLQVRDWKEINPMLAMSSSLTNQFAVIIVGIFLFALSFGIINTMLMAVLERRRELGMLGAIGMGKGAIFRMIMMETVFLTLSGSLVGIALAAAAIVPTLQSGVDLTFMMDDVFEDYGFGSVVYPIMNIQMFVEIIAAVILAGILSAIYPAMKALKLKPLEAIRK